MRVINGVLSLLLGLALLGGGLFVAVEAVAFAMGAGTPGIPVASWARLLEGRRVDDTWAIVGFASATVVGLILLVAELRPWAATRLSIAVVDDRSEGRWWIVRRSVERHVGQRVATRRATKIPRVRLRQRRGRWDARLVAVTDPETRQEVEQVTRQELSRVGAPNDARVRVRIRGRRGLRSPPRVQ